MDMTSNVYNNELLCNVELQHLRMKRNETLRLTTSSCDILYLVSGTLRVDDSPVAKFRAVSLERGTHTLVCSLSGDALFEAVVVHIDRRLLFHTIACSRDELRFADTVLRGISSNVSVEELASLCYLSVSTFKRRFADYYGIPPHRWFLWRRLEIASAMLRKSSLPTYTVAALCGFINVSHFIATFKRRYGITPSRLLRESMSRAAIGADTY